MHLILALMAAAWPYSMTAQEQELADIIKARHNHTTDAELCKEARQLAQECAKQQRLIVKRSTGGAMITAYRSEGTPKQIYELWFRDGTCRAHLRTMPTKFGVGITVDENGKLWAVARLATGQKVRVRRPQYDLRRRFLRISPVTR